MNIALYKNGSYKEFHNDDKITKNLDKIKYLLVDIATSLKGPVYSLVEAKHLSKVSGTLEISIRTSYEDIDCPSCKDKEISSRILTSSLGSQFCVYPLIRELYEFNTFKEMTGFTEDGISIEEIRIKDNLSEVKLSPNEVNGEELKNLMKAKHLYTDGNVIKSDEFIILNNDGEWKIGKGISYCKSGFAFIFCKTSTQTFYKLSSEQFYRFLNLRYLKIEAIEQVYESEFDLDASPTYTIECNDIFEFLNAALYYPQALLLDKELYNSKINFRITANATSKNYILDINNKEYGIGICLFKVIDKLLQM